MERDKVKFDIFSVEVQGRKCVNIEQLLKYSKTLGVVAWSVAFPLQEKWSRD